MVRFAVKFEVLMHETVMFDEIAIDDSPMRL